jgi:methyl-accepting chemotaxis protein
VKELAGTTQELSGTVREMGQAAEQIRSETVPLLHQLQGIAERTEAELVRMDGLMERVNSISATVDSASHLAYLAFSNPLIKALAFGSGTSRAVSRLRRRGED